MASRQAGAHLPPGEGSNTPLASPLLSPREGDGPRASQADLGTHLPSGEGSNSSPQATAHLPPREESSTSQAIAHLPPREGSNSSPATAHPLPREGSSASLATAHLPPREGSSASLATAHLPPREGSSSSQATAHLPSGEGNSNSFQATSQAGQASNQARSGRQGFRHSSRHRAPHASQENSAASQADSTNSQEGTPTPTIPSRLPQGPSNLSSKPLTPAQRSVLAKGPNFAVSPKQPPNLEYITAIEAACTTLSQQDADELRADIKSPKVLPPPKPSLTKAQNLALRELKRDRDHIVLTADKGVDMVIMDRHDYINKANHLLNQNTYRSMAKDPTNSIKNKLINILKRAKSQTGLDSNTYKSMYPTGCVPPKFYGLPKIHKPDTPLRPIVSSCGPVTYGVAKELAKVLKPLVGKSPHHITSIQDFGEQAKQIILEPGECLSSYDVSALFTSVPIDPALTIIKDLLEKDTTLKERTVMEVSDIIILSQEHLLFFPRPVL